MRAKVSIIGAGMVGASIADRLAEKNIADIVLVDIVEGLPQGKALDMWQSGAVRAFETKLVGTQNYEDTAGSQIVAITAGVPRKPGMSRDDLLFTNMKIVKEVVENVVKYSPDCILIMITNPLDAMTQLALHTSGFPRNRVMGMSGILDTARFRTFLAEALGVSVRDVHAMVLGGHGDQMVPLPRLANVNGIPVTELLPKETIDRIVERTIKGGGEIVALLKAGSAYYAPGAAVAEMIEAILLDEKRVLPCCVYLDGEYGIKGVCAGVPVKLGKNGVEEIVEIKLLPEELEALRRSAEAVRELVRKMEIPC